MHNIPLTRHAFDNMNRHNTNSTPMSPDKIGSANHKYTFN